MAPCLWLSSYVQRQNNVTDIVDVVYQMNAKRNVESNQRSSLQNIFIRLIMYYVIGRKSSVKTLGTNNAEKFSR